MEEISPQRARQLLEEGACRLLDVREPVEREWAALEPATAIPMARLPEALKALDPDVPVLVMCHHGVRSAMAGRFLEQNGFDTVWNLQGGIDAWSREIDPDVPRY